MRSSFGVMYGIAWAQIAEQCTALGAFVQRLQGDERGVEAFEVADHERRAAALGRRDHPVRLF